MIAAALAFLNSIEYSISPKSHQMFTGRIIIIVPEGWHHCYNRKCTHQDDWWSHHSNWWQSLDSRKRTRELLDLNARATCFHRNNGCFLGKIMASYGICFSFYMSSVFPSLYMFRSAEPADRCFEAPLDLISKPCDGCSVCLWAWNNQLLVNRVKMLKPFCLQASGRHHMSCI